MEIILLLLLVVLIGFPMLIFSLLKSAAHAKEKGDVALQWFLIWLVAVLTLLPMVGIIVYLS